MIADSANRTQWRHYLLKLSFPIMVSNSSVPLVGIVDTAVMGRMGAPEWIAATAVGAIIFSSIYWIFGFLRMGTGGLVAQAYGAGDQDEAGKTAVRALGIAFCIGTLLILLEKPILSVGLSAMADTSDWKALTAIYFSIRLICAPATLMTYVIVGTLIGLQRMRAVLILQLLLNLLNIVLNLAFFRFTDWGIAGVAWATVISEYATLALGLYLSRALLSRAISIHPVSSWLFDPLACLRYVQISGDLFIRTLCLTFAFYYMTVLGSRLGVQTLAINTLLMHLVHFSSYVMDGYAHAIETLTGYAVGRKSKAVFQRAVRAAIELGAATALVFCAVYWIAGESLLSLISTDPETLSLANQWLPWAIAAPLIGIASFLLDGIFIGATQTKPMRNGMIISLLVFLLSTSVLVPLLGNHGIWLSYYLLLIARAATLSYQWRQLTNSIG